MSQKDKYDPYNIIENYRYENEKLKEKIKQWERADKENMIAVVFIGLFIFIPIGVIVGAIIFK